jgi:regulation of enolase protein 1 (concanavalin A-like superfamily)
MRCNKRWITDGGAIPAGLKTCNTIVADVRSVGKKTYKAESVRKARIAPAPDNDAPHIQSGYVVPESGGTLTMFQYFATYLDEDNDPPVTMAVYIDDEEYRMEQFDPADEDYTDGAVFVFRTRLSEGIHTFYFEAYDGLATTTMPADDDVWSVTVADCLVIVDDFESYTDAIGNRIFETWKDGYGYGDLELGYPGNGTGSRASLNVDLNYSGEKSMQFDYDNTGTAKNIFGDLITACYSETEWRFDSPQDWTRDGVKALSLWFRGYPASVGSFTEGPVGTYTMTAAGADIWGTSDQFHYVFRPLAGDGEATVHLASMDVTSPWAKAGVMVRETLDGNSEHAMIAMTGTHGVQTVWRQETGGSSADVTTGGVSAPCWIRIERVGDTINTYHSPNGLMWIPQQSLNIPMSPTVYIGMGVCSRQSDTLCTAVFSNLTTSGNVSSVWMNQDIGMVTNDPEPMYVGVEDSMGMSKLVNHPSPNAVLLDTWQEWNIDLREFSDAGVDLTNVRRMYIGVGDRDDPTAGGRGTIYFDQVRLCPARCVPDYRPVADLNNDCVVDYIDLKIMAEEWLNSNGLQADLYEDNKVDFKDFAVLAETWLEEPTLWP